MRGVRLIDFQSLMDYINGRTEPAYIEKKSVAPHPHDDREITSVQKLELSKSLRVIISIRCETETETAAEPRNVSP